MAATAHGVWTLLREFVASEARYVSGVTRLQEKYVAALLDDAQSPRPRLLALPISNGLHPENAVFFSAVQQILTLQRNFLESLQSAAGISTDAAAGADADAAAEAGAQQQQQQQQQPTMQTAIPAVRDIAQVMLRFAPLFQVYTQYVMKHGAVLHQIEQTFYAAHTSTVTGSGSGSPTATSSATSPASVGSDTRPVTMGPGGAGGASSGVPGAALRDFFHFAEDDEARQLLGPSGRKRGAMQQVAGQAACEDFKALSTKPLNQITRYTEVVESLKGALQQIDEAAAVVAALDRVDDALHETANRIAEARELATQRRHIHAAERRWGMNFVTAGRKLRREGPLTKVSRSKHIPYVFILFSDIIAYGAPNELSGKVSHHRSIELKGMRVQLCNSPAHAFQIVSASKSFTVLAKTDEERDQWFNEIRDAIQELRSSIRYTDMPADGTLAPVWVPDMEKDECTFCHCTFNMINRRHHCRRCGRLVCNTCSLHRLPMNRLVTNSEDTEWVRACDECNEQVRDRLSVDEKQEYNRRMASTRRRESAVSFFQRGSSTGDGGRGSAASVRVGGSPKNAAFGGRGLPAPVQTSNPLNAQQLSAAQQQLNQTRGREDSDTTSDDASSSSSSSASSPASGIRALAFSSSASTPPTAGAATLASLAQPSATASPAAAVASPAAAKSHRQRVVEEMLSTEETYVSFLTVLWEQCVEKLLIDAQSSMPTIGKICRETSDDNLTSMTVFFHSVDQLRTLNQRLLADLRERIAEGAWDDGQCVGDIFAGYAPLFRLYWQYADSQEFASKTIADYVQKDPVLREFLDDAERDPDMRGQSIQSLLIMPIQRVPRYQLLLQTCLDETRKALRKSGRDPDDHPDVPHLLDALEKVKDSAHHINGFMHIRERKMQLFELQRRWSHDFNAPDRAVLLEGALVKQCRRAPREYRFVLFNDSLAYGTPSVTDDRYVTHHRTMELSECRPMDLDKDVAFQIDSKQKAFVVYAQTPADKQRWLKTMSEAVQARREALSQAGVAVADDHQFAAVWTPDSEQSVCSICSASFNVFNRRHHCRVCGALACGDCTAARMVVDYIDPNHEVRVCQSCSQRLANPQLAGAPPTAASAESGEAQRKQPHPMAEATTNPIAAPSSTPPVSANQPLTPPVTGAAAGTAGGNGAAGTLGRLTQQPQPQLPQPQPQTKTQIQTQTQTQKRPPPPPKRPVVGGSTTEATAQDAKRPPPPAKKKPGRASVGVDTAAAVAAVTWPPQPPVATPGSATSARESMVATVVDVDSDESENESSEESDDDDDDEGEIVTPRGAAIGEPEPPAEQLEEQKQEQPAQQEGAPFATGQSQEQSQEQQQGAVDANLVGGLARPLEDHEPDSPSRSVDVPRGSIAERAGFSDAIKTSHRRRHSARRMSRRVSKALMSANKLPCKIRSMFHFVTSEDGELPMSPGEELTITNINGDWLLAYKPDGTCGWVPRNYVMVIDML